MMDFFVDIALPANFHMWVTMAVIAMAVLAYASEKFSMEITSITVLSGLLVFFHLFPLESSSGELLLNTEKLLLGFSNPALIAVVALLVLGQAVVQTGALNEVANVILKLSRNNAMLSIIMSLLVVMIVSGLLNNTPVVVIFIPILSALAKNINLSTSKVMIPLSYTAIMGGMLTLIGSSTNLLVSGMLPELGVEPLQFFDFTLPGAVMAMAGLVYVVFIAPKLLVDRASLVKNLAGDDKRQFIAQIEVDYTSDLIGKQLDLGHFPEFPEITIRMVQRGEHAFLPPFEENMGIRAGDIIIVGATRKDLTALLAQKPEILTNHLPDSDDEEAEQEQPSFEKDIIMAEVVVAPASRMIRRNLEQIGFHHQHNCVVLGIQRQSRIIRARVTEIRLAPGDVLLVMGKREDILALQNNSDLLLMEWSTEEIHTGVQGTRAAVIFFSVAGLAAFNIIPIAISAFAGVAAIIMSKCLNIRQAARAIDMQIILMIAASLAMGTALQATGGAGYLAHILIEVMAGAQPQIVMSALFLLMMGLTNVLSNNASAVLFTPIAVGVAQELGVDPKMFIFAVIFACNCSFITPIGYQTNLLVMGPGHHKFIDFIKAGIPLGLIMWATYTALTFVFPEFFNLPKTTLAF